MASSRFGDSAMEAKDLEHLFSLSVDLLCVAGLDGYFKRVNPAFEKLLGYSEDELLASQFVEFVHPDDRESTVQEVANLAAGALTVDFENRYRTRDGEYRWLAWRAAPLVERGLVFAVARDITSQKRDREPLARQAAELERSNADLAQFAYVASHDLRAPLRSIISLTGFIEEDLSDSIPDATRGHLEELRRRALAMRALTDDLLVFSQAGAAGDSVTAVNTASLVEEVAFLLDPPEGLEIVTRGASVQFETAAGPLEQVLRNLVGNAIKHHDREIGTVAVSAEEAGDFVKFTVSDDGPGIPAQDRKRVFRAFNRSGARPDAAGTGLGLAIVQRILQGFGGRIEIEPGGDRGTTVRFLWPRQWTAESDSAAE